MMGKTKVAVMTPEREVLVSFSSFLWFSFTLSALVNLSLTDSWLFKPKRPLKTLSNTCQASTVRQAKLAATLQTFSD